MDNWLLGNERGGILTKWHAAGVQEMVQWLVRQATNGTSLSTLREPDGGAREVILDMEVDGVRCLLIRSQPKFPRVQVKLSPREREIARMVAKGHPDKSIAAALKISYWTVCTHLRRIFSKLGVGSRAAMVARLLEEGLMGEQPGHAELPPLRRK